MLRRSRQLPGAARLSGSPALLGVNFDNPFVGEESLGPADKFPTGQLSQQDVRHFYNKTVKQLINVTALTHAAAGSFGALNIEETLSESRMNDSCHSPPTRCQDDNGCQDIRITTPTCQDVRTNTPLDVSPAQVEQGFRK